jgi:hypothetical protein
MKKKYFEKVFFCSKNYGCAQNYLKKTFVFQIKKEIDFFSKK